MATTLSSRITKKGQTTIPVEIRHFLKIDSGDKVSFEVKNNQVVLYKAADIDMEHLKATESTLQEWNSKEDEKLFQDW